MGETPRPHRRAFFDPHFVATERRRPYRMAYMLFWTILLYLFFRHFVIGTGIVTDRSMLPTLHEGEYYLINKYAYHLAKPHRGDIVIVRPRAFSDDQYVKRVVGLGEETVEIRSGRVYINDQPLEEPYATGRTYPNLGPIRLKPDHYFVLGDNRLASEDSRRFGSVPRQNLEGKIKPGEWFPF